MHPQSIVHSMVELVDGATLAQLSMPEHAPADRVRPRLPGAPRRGLRAGRLGGARWSSPSSRPTATCSAVSTSPTRAGRDGGGAPAWLNAANEVAVAAFLAGRIGWLSIAEVVADTSESFDDEPIDSLEAVLEADRLARDRAEPAVEKRGGAA